MMTPDELFARLCLLGMKAAAALEKVNEAVLVREGIIRSNLIREARQHARATFDEPTLRRFRADILAANRDLRRPPWRDPNVIDAIDETTTHDLNSPALRAPAGVRHRWRSGAR